MKFFVSSILFFLCLSMVCTTGQQTTPDCAVIVDDLYPCFTYVKGRGDPSAGCCRGVSELAQLAKTEDGLRQVCSCVQHALKSADYDPNLIPSIPVKCGVQGIRLPPINQSTDCSGKALLCHSCEQRIPLLII